MIEWESLLQVTPKGLYCPPGRFFIDPRRPVDRAVVTHAHSDHARPGSRYYLASDCSRHLLRMRLGSEAEMEFLRFGSSVHLGGVDVSFHPAGHMLGSAQVRLEYRGRVAVVTGDYKVGEDSTCRSWEPVPCDLMVTESTFGLPIYQWPKASEVFGEINRWWRRNQQHGRCSILYGYAVGKSQSMLAGLDPDLGPIFTHGAVEKGTQAYRDSGVALPTTTHVGSVDRKRDWSQSMVVAVPSAHGTPWIRRFGQSATAMASGWMAVRGSRRRRAVDRGFVLSDHVDWGALLESVRQCDPETVWVTHGYSASVARYLNDQGRCAVAIDSRSRSETEEEFAADSETADTEPSADDGDVGVHVATDDNGDAS